jgi:ABC-2 type transport system ATP-binding protein
MSDEIAIRVNRVSKSFKLPHEKKSSIKSIFTSIGKKHGSIEVQHALKDVSFEIKKGEFFGIVGRNGSGKSTMLKILAEIYQPSNGSVDTTGKLVPFIELGVGFNPELTGRENVYLSGALSGFSTAEMDRMYDDIVQFAELEQFMDQKLKNYSSGMQVRLAFSVATRSKADILLIDEVLAVGDADFQRKCFDYFKSLKKSGTTVVFVSHDMNAVREYCDKAVLIDQSKLVTIGEPDHVAGAYTRLFTEEEAEEEEGEQRTRWGNRAVEFDSVKITKRITNKSESLSMIAKARFNQDVVSPIFGFTIKDPAGKAITGVNNQILREKTGRYKKGDVVTIEWLVANMFSNGKHTVDITIIGEDGVTNYDWWEDAAQFTVEKVIVTPYITSPDIKVKIHG